MISFYIYKNIINSDEKIVKFATKIQIDLIMFAYEEKDKKLFLCRKIIF
jgi:hypothetical protein